MGHQIPQSVIFQQARDIIEMIFLVRSPWLNCIFEYPDHDITLLYSATLSNNFGIVERDQHYCRSRK